MRILNRSLISVVGLILHASLAFAAAPREIPASQIPLFQNITKVQMTIEAPFKELWAISKRLNPDPFLPANKTKEAYVDGKVSYIDGNGQSITIPMKIRVRGTSSKADCEFPKLELKFKKPAVAGTIFENSKEVKIGTHCADVEGESGKHRRLRNQLEPAREVFVYRLAEFLGIRSLKTRFAQINYVITDDGQKEILRNAFFLEDTGAARKRYGGLKEIFVKGSPEALEAEKEAKEEGETIPAYFGDIEKTDLEETARVFFFDIMISNNDFRVKIANSKTKQSLWNIKAFLEPDGSQFIMPLDFDLAGIVRNASEASWLTQDLARARETFRDYPQVVAPFKELVLSRSNDIYLLLGHTDFTYPEIGTGVIREDFAGKQLVKEHLDQMLGAIQNTL